MRIIEADINRDLHSETIFRCGSFEYKLNKDFLKMPENLRYTPIVTGCCDAEDNIYLATRDADHPIVKGIDWSTPYMFLGYNKVYLREDAHLVASYKGDVQIATRNVGKGRTCVFTSDVGPHWAGNFLEHPDYRKFWQQCARWVAGAAE